MIYVSNILVRNATFKQSSVEEMMEETIDCNVHDCIIIKSNLHLTSLNSNWKLESSPFQTGGPVLLVLSWTHIITLCISACTSGIISHTQLHRMNRLALWRVPFII